MSSVEMWPEARVIVLVASVFNMLSEEGSKLKYAQVHSGAAGCASWSWVTLRVASDGVGLAIW